MFSLNRLVRLGYVACLLLGAVALTSPNPSKAQNFRTHNMLIPPGAGANAARVVEQAVPLFLPRQPGEAGVQRVVGDEEGFLAVQHRRVGGGPPGGGVSSARNAEEAEALQPFAR